MLRPIYGVLHSIFWAMIPKILLVTQHREDHEAPLNNQRNRRDILRRQRQRRMQARYEPPQVERMEIQNGELWQEEQPVPEAPMMEQEDKRSEEKTFTHPALAQLRRSINAIRQNHINNELNLYPDLRN